MNEHLIEALDEQITAIEKQIEDSQGIKPLDRRISFIETAIAELRKLREKRHTLLLQDQRDELLIKLCQKLRDPEFDKNYDSRYWDSAWKLLEIIDRGLEVKNA